MRADLARLGDERSVPSDLDPGPPTVFRADATWPALLADRIDALERHPDDVRTVDPRVAADALRAAGAAVAQHAAAEQPERVVLEHGALVLRGLALRVTLDGALEEVATQRACDAPEPDTARVVRSGGRREPLVDASLRQRAAAQLRARPPHLRMLEALALALQEDLVLIGPSERSDAGAGRVQWLQVAFPSGWDPGAMVGASFERLHAPVPDAEVLRRAAPALVQAMRTKGPFVRYVWGLSPSGARSRHPRHARPMPSDHPLDGAWLRVERQTTLPLPAVGAGLFAIGVHVTPLPVALAAPDRRAAFADAVASLTPVSRRYKGVPWDEATVRAWCATLG